MKRLLPLLLISATVNAHSQYPQEFEPVKTISKFSKVEFTLTNLNDTRTCYNVEINNVIYSPYRECLNPNQSKEMGVYVQNIPNDWAQNAVCTISDTKDSFRTRMCTTYQAYYYVQ